MPKWQVFVIILFAVAAVLSLASAVSVFSHSRAPSAGWYQVLAGAFFLIAALWWWRRRV